MHVHLDAQQKRLNPPPPPPKPNQAHPLAYYYNVIIRCFCYHILIIRLYHTMILINFFFHLNVHNHIVTVPSPFVFALQFGSRFALQLWYHSTLKTEFYNGCFRSRHHGLLGVLCFLQEKAGCAQSTCNG